MANSLLIPAELILNAVLRQDPESRDNLKQFVHRSIAIKIETINCTIIVKMEDQQLLLDSNTNTDADLTISATIIALIKLWQNPNNLFSKDIEIQGDTQLAKQLSDLLSNFGLDWEALISYLTGYTMAHPLAYGLRQATVWAKSAHTSMKQNLAEYLREEIKLLPDQSPITYYLTGIDKLRADCDRLAARINRSQGKT